jgi:Raf kinase inhibitor-like YbhB/YbcL family protein
MGIHRARAREEQTQEPPHLGKAFRPYRLGSAAKRGRTVELCLVAGIAALMSTGCAGAAAPGAGINPSQMTLTSPAFQHGAPIPHRFSAYGENVSPALNWSNLPAGTRSLALIMEDPDAPTERPFVHWVVYNIQASEEGLPEISSPTRPVLDAAATIRGARQGPTDVPETLEDFPRIGYFGPHPPLGPPHNYHFRLYALSSEPTLPAGLTASELREAMAGNILGEALLIGTYQATR